jgi:alpha-tubulin suppressor-like RCC1 family protein
VIGQRRARVVPGAWRLVMGGVVVAVAAMGLAGCVADPPPIMGAVVPGNGRVLLSWEPPLAEPAPVTAYIVTPYVGGTALRPVRFSSTATSQIVGGLTNGIAHTFSVKAVNARGHESASSAMSEAVVPGQRLGVNFGRACAIVASGAVKCWGSRTRTPAEVPGLSDATEIALAGGHGCALVLGGAVKCWGSNQDGRLGTGTSIDYSASALPVAGVTDAIAVATQNERTHTCALIADGTVTCWGGPDFPIPVQMAGITDATAIGAGAEHSCAVVSGGAVKCWGYNWSGQLGTGAFSAPVATPVDVVGITGATAVTGTREATCVRQPGGVMKCWGSNTGGILGGPTTMTPVSISGMTGARAIAGGWEHMCAITDGGVPKCWGSNSWGQLGDGGTVNSTSTPTPVVGITNAIGLAAGAFNTCAAVGYAVSCWGDNEFGQLGIGSPSGISSTPFPISGL